MINILDVCRNKHSTTPNTCNVETDNFEVCDRSGPYRECVCASRLMSGFLIPWPRPSTHSHSLSRSHIIKVKMV